MEVVATEQVREGAPVLYADVVDGALRLAAGPGDDGPTRTVDLDALGDPALADLPRLLAAGFWADRPDPAAPFARHHHHHDHDDDDERLDAKVARIEATIAEDGFACFPVLITEEDRESDPDAVDFTYSAGLRDTFDHPDLLVSGMEMRSAYDTIATVVDLLREGHRFGHGDTSDQVLRGSRVLFVEIPDAERRDLMAMTAGMYGGEPFAALQIVFPDREHRWPWEPGSKAVPQQVLGEAPTP